MTVKNFPDDPLAALQAELADLTARVKTLAPEIADEAQERHVRVIFDMASDLAKRADAERRKAKIPHEKAAKEVDENFKPVCALAAVVKEDVRQRLTFYLARIEEQRQEAARAMREAALRAEQEAQEAEDPFAKFDAQRSADEQGEAATSMEQEASARPQIASVGGVGKAVSLRTSWDIEVTDPIALVERFKDSPAMLDLAKSLALAVIRAQKGSAAGVPGVKVIEIRKAV